MQCKRGLLAGKLKEYYATGEIYREEGFLERNSEGAYKLFWLEGTDRILGTKKYGEFEGAYTIYFRNGILTKEGKF